MAPPDEFTLLVKAIESYLEPVRFAPDTCLFEEGSPSDCFFLVDAGEVRLEVHSDERDADTVLGYTGPGSLLGEVGVLAQMPRSAAAYAHTEVQARRMTGTTLERLYATNSPEGLAVARLLGRDAALKVRVANERLAEHLSSDVGDSEIDKMVASAATAQQLFAPWREERVDDLLRDIAITIAGHAGELGAATVKETGIGDPEDKAEKIRFGSVGVFASFEGNIGCGLLGADPERKITEFLGPVGVVFAMTPVTEPVSTFVDNVLISLKARNALIVSPHRSSQQTAALTDDIIQDVLVRHSAPAGLVQLVRDRTSRQKTARFMRHEGVALILATGGPSMVKAAYSSGTPAIGVGAGNAPVWIAPDADLTQTAQCIVQSKAFDYGLICGAEQHLVVDSSIRDAFVAVLREAGTLVLDENETQRFVDAAFTAGGRLRMELIGQPAPEIAAATGVSPSDDIRLIAFAASADHVEGAFATERLAPVVALYTADGDDAALDLCHRLLRYEGTGHTAVIHSRDDDRIQRFAAEMPASRILVNVPASHGCGGVLTGLVPSMTLGCGTYGGNSTTDNVGYRNLVNIKRVARMQFTNLLNTKRLSSR